MFPIFSCTYSSLSCAKKDIAEGTLGLLAKNRRRNRISCLSSTMKELQQMVWCNSGRWLFCLREVLITHSYHVSPPVEES